ncbi:flippase [Pseudoalteromonas sp.]|uniref:flippase n=1 Tax=Pseudoalteromonas sp. TaxID=53249 RepID=UPI0035699A05
MEQSPAILNKFLGTAGLQVASKALSVVAGVILARYLGPEQYGLYTYVLSIIAILTIPVIAGLPQLLIREIAQAELAHEWHELKGLLRWSTAFIIITSAIVMLTTMVILQLGFITSQTASLLWFALFLIPIKSFSSKQGAILNGFRKPILGLFPEFILMPLLAILIYLYFIVSKTVFTSLLLIKVQIVTSALTLLLGMGLIFKERAKNLEQVNPIYRLRKWHIALLPFTLMVFISTMNAQLAHVFLGYFDEKESVAAFKVALQGVTLVTLGFAAVNNIIGPRVARLYKSGDIPSTQALLTKSVKLSACFSIPIAIVLIFFGDWFIGLLFGEQYLASYPILIILCIGQIINICFGSVSLVLNMTGNEKRSLKALCITLCINIFLLFILVPSYKAIGAALSVSVSLVLWNVWMSADVYSITKLKTWLC